MTGAGAGAGFGALGLGAGFLTALGLGAGFFAAFFTGLLAVFFFGFALLGAAFPARRAGFRAMGLRFGLAFAFFFGAAFLRLTVFLDAFFLAGLAAFPPRRAAFFAFFLVAMTIALSVLNIFEGDNKITTAFI
ncbi:MAG: hypothetical protein FJY20_01690 [Bacteroidetes bacterium]|nr:hypothetical protein [Bacteroidota bacterium]